jgi:hypothetical protein
MIMANTRPGRLFIVMPRRVLFVSVVMYRAGSVGGAPLCRETANIANIANRFVKDAGQGYSVH